MIPKSKENHFAQGYRKNAQGSGIGLESMERFRGPGQLLTNRLQPGEDHFRLPEDGFIHLVPVGEFPARYSNGEEVVEIVQVVDEKAINAMARSFEGELLLDYDHHALQQDKQSRAAGWIQDVQARADGLWGRIRWSNTGRNDVEGGDYRYVSPVFDPRDAERIQDNQYRMLRLDGAALTNSPNMRTLTPLSNRRQQSKPEKKMNEKLLNRLRRFFGLAEDANEEAILNAVPAEQTHQTVTEEVTRLQNREQQLLGELADHDLQGFQLSDEQKKTLRKGLIENRESTLTLLKAVPQPPKKVFNRDTATPPDASKMTHEQADQRGTKIANRADEIYKAANGAMTYAAAFNAAQSEFEQK